MSEDLKIVRRVLDDERKGHTILSHVSSSLYGKVWNAHLNTGYSMSRIAAMCMEEAVYKVEQKLLKEKRKRDDEKM